MEILGITLTALGEILIGLAVVRVHWRVMKEHKIDQAVFKAMKREQRWAIIGILLIVAGFVLEVVEKTGVQL